MTKVTSILTHEVMKGEYVLKKKRKEKIAEFASKNEIQAIEMMEEILGIKFKGENRKDIEEFLREGMRKIESPSFQKKLQTPQRVRTAQVDLTTGGSLGSIDEYSFKDSIYEEELRGAIARGVGPAEALNQFEHKLRIARMHGEGGIYKEEQPPFYDYDCYDRD